MSVQGKDKELEEICIYGGVEVRSKLVSKLGKIMTQHLYQIKALQNME